MINPADIQLSRTSHFIPVNPRTPSRAQPRTTNLKKADSPSLVAPFRLVYDHGTGKPKGFGFCEYRDPETAASALRNLQGVDVGGRQLRLDFADTADVSAAKRDRGPPGSEREGVRGPTGNPGKPLPSGVALLPGVSAVDSISQTLAAMPPGQLLDIMSQMKVGVLFSLPRDGFHWVESWIKLTVSW